MIASWRDNRGRNGFEGAALGWAGGFCWPQTSAREAGAEAAGTLRVETQGGGVSAGENGGFGHKKPEVTLPAAVSALRR